jgi:hypothetical protein
MTGWVISHFQRGQTFSVQKREKPESGDERRACSAGDGSTHAEQRRATRCIASATPSLVRVHRAFRSFRSVTGVRRPSCEHYPRESNQTTRKSDTAVRLSARLRRSLAELARLAECKRFGSSLAPESLMRRVFDARPLPARAVPAVAPRVAAERCFLYTETVFPRQP